MARHERLLPIVLSPYASTSTKKEIKHRHVARRDDGSDERLQQLGQLVQGSHHRKCATQQSGPSGRRKADDSPKQENSQRHGPGPGQAEGAHPQQVDAAHSHGPSLGLGGASARRRRRGQRHALRADGKHPQANSQTDQAVPHPAGTASTTRETPASTSHPEKEKNPFVQEKNPSKYGESRQKWRVEFSQEVARL